MYQIELSRRAQKQFALLPKQYSVRISETIGELATNPLAGKKLSGELAGQYSVRVWPYRILYEIYKKELIVLIIKIDHRKDAYK